MGEFCVASYRRIIRLFIKESYECVTFGTKRVMGRRHLFLRHDIDYSLEVAVRFAEVNSSLGIRGHFFINLRSPLYNALARRNVSCLRQIADLGQDIGLHYYFAPQAGPDSLERVIEEVRNECDLLRGILGKASKRAVSWHNPSVLGEGYRDLVASKIPGILNVNSLGNEGVVYVSDSNHRYTVDQWLKMPMKGHERIQALFHPFQWVLGAPKMEGVLAGVWKQVIREHESEYLTNHVYRARFPNGLPERGLEAWVRPLGRRR